MVPGGVGQFRCVVTDPYTRKTAVSDIGYVYTEMKVLSYEQIGTEKKLKMEFEGGVAPYDITVNAYYTTIWGYEFDDKFYFGWQITEYHNTHVNKNRYDATSQCSIREENIYDHTEINIGVPELYSRQLYKEQYTWMALIPPIYYKTNTYILYPYLYQVVITDALGNQLETAWVVCKWE